LAYSASGFGVLRIAAWTLLGIPKGSCLDPGRGSGRAARP
jgi:hypothetical protein